ncbi:MAG: hypothetical protein KGK18_10280, partial [Burkholderiales bacterium]|nr:hypothetical protein [Burkholderiales bacterium]
TNDLLSNRTASNQASIMTTQLLQLMRDADLAKNAMGYDQTLDAWKKDPNSKFANLSARWTDTLRELGTVVLPIAIKGLEGLISLLKRASSFAHEFPAFTKGLVLASAAIFALAAAGGTLKLFRAGLQGVGLALNVLSLGAGGGMLASVATGLTALGSALPGLLGKLGLLGFVGYGTYSIATALGADKLGSWIGGKVFDWTHPDGGQMLTQPGGKGFHARGNEADGSPFVKNNAGAGRGYINNTIVMPNGQTLAKVVTHEQSRAAARPQTGTSAFDGRAGLLPAGAN